MRPSRLERILHHTPKRITANCRDSQRRPDSGEVAWQQRADWQRTPRAVFIGRLAPEKGLDMLIEAWPFVRARYPEARLTLIGEGPRAPALEDQGQDTLGLTLGPGQAVELPGAATDPS